LSDWAELVRLPNVFTVMADSLAAAILVSSGELFWPSLILVVIASIGMYWGGMILNDVADLEEDRPTRPNRPLVSGRISPVIAGHVGNGMLIVAPLLILLATNIAREQPLWMGVAFITALGLSLTIRLYDSPMKRTLIGPGLMGLCRALNIIMAGCASLATQESLNLPNPLFFMAAGIGIYILGITVFARREEGNSQPASLMLGILFEAIGLGIIASMPWLSGDHEARPWQVDPYGAFPVLIGLIGLTVLNRGVQAVNHAVPRKVQLAVKHAILTLILLDAAIAAVSAGPWIGGSIAALLIPAMLVGGRFRST
jgi:4-hydroxybenzoate polyprenyltransferase